jgi:hypothetical protein
MSPRFSALHVPVKTLAMLPQRRVDRGKSAASRPRECLQISSRLVSDILRPVKNPRAHGIG